MKRLVIIAALAFILPGASTALAQSGSSTIPAGSRVFVEDMPEGLDGFLRAEFLKKKIPLVVVMSPDKAEFFLSGDASTRKGSWHEGWLSPEKDQATGSVALVRKGSDELVWAEEAGDRSILGGPLFRRGGARKVASRIADRLKKHMNGTRSTGG